MRRKQNTPDAGLLGILLSGVLAGAALNSAFGAQPDSKAAALFAAAKQAMGGAALDRVTTWDERGRLSAGGLSGTYETVDDLPGQKRALSYVLGPDRGGQGWDGERAWTTDASGQVRVETSREAEAAAIQQVYLSTNAFLFPKRWPAETSYAGQKTADGVTYEAVRVTPTGAEPVELWFDPSTHLVAREIQLTGPQPQTYLLSDWTKVGNVRVPGKTTVRVGGNPKFDQVVEVEHVEQNKTMPANRFAPPPPPAYDAIFPAKKTSVTVPFRLINNHIYLEASINGHPPQPFVFDTGATNFFDHKHAAALGVKLEGALPGGGFGSDISETGLAKVGSVSIGGLTLKDQVFAADDSTKWIAVEGADSAGLVGYEFAKRAVTTIDYAARTITFTKPDDFHAPDAPSIPFTFDGHIPMVQASVDGASGEFEIDTGARSALTLMRPFAEAHGLVEKYKAIRSATTGYGVGGPSRALLARPGALVIGDTTLKNPVADLVMDKAGAAAAARTAGNIGGDILKRFTVTLDYGHQKIWLAPNALSAEPDVFDRSGIWISRAADGNILIADVSGDSAAAKAGLKSGDVIRAVDGKPAAGIALYDLREQFRGKPGTVFTLSVAGTQERDVKLSLADQV